MNKDRDFTYLPNLELGSTEYNAIVKIQTTCKFYDDCTKCPFWCCLNSNDITDGACVFEITEMSSLLHPEMTKKLKIKN